MGSDDTADVRACPTGDGRAKDEGAAGANGMTEAAFGRVVEVMARLRAPGGCPWDRVQTHHTLREYLVEECHEVLDAIDEGSDRKLCDELGDVLLQVVFHAQLAAEEGRFDITAVCDGLVEKLIRRHPHVFGAVTGIEQAEEVVGVWEARKRAEAGADQRQSTLDGIPSGLPSLHRSEKMQRRAARVGFDWPDQASRLEKIGEELRELAEALEDGDRQAVEAEFGDLLFMVVNAGRGLGLHAEDALRTANRKFERRFRRMEALAGGAEAFAELELADQDRLWDQAKAEER